MTVSMAANKDDKGKTKDINIQLTLQETVNNKARDNTTHNRIEEVIWVAEFCWTPTVHTYTADKHRCTCINGPIKF